MNINRLKFDVFGQHMVVEHSKNGWKAYYSGNEGKRRAADITIPSKLDASEIAKYLDDLFHESATERHPTVRIIE